MTTAVAQFEDIAPAELVSLRDLIAGAPEGQEPAPEQTVWYEGVAYDLVGVGERTATLAPRGERWADRLSKRHELILVEPGAVRWQPAAPSPREAFARVALDAETRRARAEYLSEGREISTADRNAARREQPPSRLIDSERTCSRPGCDTALHISNKAGECRACQRKCPTCERPKSVNARQCASCGSKGGRQPGAVTATERLCATCEQPLGVRAKTARCLKCRRRCACGRPKHEEADHCRACGRAALPTPASRDETPVADVLPLPATSSPREEEGDDRGAGALTLAQIPDIVADLVNENEELRARVRELEAEVTRCRAREEAYLDVERRVQAVIARSRTGRG